MTERFDLSNKGVHELAVTSATNALRQGKLVVLPTDTVYGIGCDAFDPVAVNALLKAKGRGRAMPPPVLVSSAVTLEALGDGFEPWVLDLVEEYWPGPLTVVVRQRESLRWDLGETRGTVAVRMPDHKLTLGLLGRFGPLAVSSANTSGLPAADSIESAEEMLGEAVSIYLDDGSPRAGEASTILDCTTAEPRILREGAISLAELVRWCEDHDVDTDLLTDPDGDVVAEDDEDDDHDGDDEDAEYDDAEYDGDDQYEAEED